VISTQAKPRLLKFYSFQPPEKHQELVRSVFQLLSARPDGVSNFVEVDSIFGPVRANLGYANASDGKRNGFNCYTNCFLWFWIYRLKS